METVTIHGHPIRLKDLVGVSTSTTVADPMNPTKGLVTSLTVTYSCGDPTCPVLHRNNAGGESFRDHPWETIQLANGPARADPEVRAAMDKIGTALVENGRRALGL
jgi:hypothetical protein